MANRYKKDYTPAPPLLLMPAGGGLTFTPPDHPNVLMPVVQPTQVILAPDFEAEADSFVGQSSTPQLHAQRKTVLQENSFQSPANSGHESFAQVCQPPYSAVPTFTPTHMAARTENAKISGSSNMYRHQGGRPQYAAPPSGSQPSISDFSSVASQGSGTPTAMVPPTASSTITNIPPNGSFQPYSKDPSINVHAVQDNSGQYTGGLYYQPVRHHWCYQQNQGDVEIWRPFSVLDSMHLEIAFNTRLQEAPNGTFVLTNGGRHDVNVGLRMCAPVYWNHEPVPVRRCSWFYKRQSDHRYIPYEEDLAVQLENEYKKAMETGGWHHRREFPGGVVIIMESANEIVQLPTPNHRMWDNVQGDKIRPRVVKRGVESFATIEHGEREEVDHLVFVVPGIEDTATSKGKTIEAEVDDLRSNTMALLNSHFTQAFQSKSINRVEFLPVMWTQVLQDRTTRLEDQVRSVTLPSSSKLRHLLNNTLVDMLFYTSPILCEKICETVASEMNRMFHIFLTRNSSFSGDVSVIGHGLGSVILFDLLQNQRLPGDLILHSEDQKFSEQPAIHAVPNVQHDVHEDSQLEVEETEIKLTLEALFSKIGLQDKVSLFQKEQIDVDSLIMCSEQDLKDIGLPLGPRKKLLEYLKEEKDIKDKKAEKHSERKIKEDFEQRNIEARVDTNAANDGAYSHSCDHHFTAKYIQGHCGAGQLKINYPQLDFTPSAFFALGSPIGVFLSLRGVQDLGELFQLPTCPRVFNVFHPFDPMAYRLEPLIKLNAAAVKPVQVPHYKGRKRLHLEFKEAVTRYGTDIKQKIVDSFKSTWNTINDLAHSYKSDAKSSSMNNEVQSEMNQMMSHIAQQISDDDAASESSFAEDENDMGHLNEGLRVDYVLQEGPLESFNDYLFALDSHSCYWESEDTALMLLKEVYSPLGFRPVMPGADGAKALKGSSFPPSHPPLPVASILRTSSPLPPASSYQTSGSYQASPATFQPPATNFQGSQLPFGASLPLGTPAGLPPPMFSPGSQMLHEPRKSPYVANNFSKFPSSQNQGAASPPPMGPALPHGYRKVQH